MRLPIRKLSIRALTTTGKLLVVLGISLLLAGVSFAYSVLENDKSGQSGQDNTGGLTLREGSEAVATDEADKVEDSDEEDKDKTKAKDENKQAEQPKDSNPDNSGDDEQPATCVGGQHTPGGPDGMGGCWPGPHNTGVPAGTTLSNYTGTCSLRTDNQIIDSKLINNCSGGMHIYASNVTIRNTKINGPINTNSGGSLTIIDSEVNGGSVHSQALGVNNLTALRVNVYGNQHAIHCNSNCDIRDSWMHDQYDGSSMGWHQNGYITNGGSNIILKHNTADCVGACTADIALLNDDDLANVAVDGNLLIGTTEVSYCFYGGGHNSKPGTNTNIVVKNNIFQKGSNGKCGQYGPVAIFDSKPGNVWSNNRWMDGTLLED